MFIWLFFSSFSLHRFLPPNRRRCETEAAIPSWLPMSLVRGKGGLVGAHTGRWLVEPSQPPRMNVVVCAVYIYIYIIYIWETITRGRPLPLPLPQCLMHNTLFHIIALPRTVSWPLASPGLSPTLSSQNGLSDLLLKYPFSRRSLWIPAHAFCIVEGIPGLLFSFDPHLMPSFPPSLLCMPLRLAGRAGPERDEMEGNWVILWSVQMPGRFGV